MERGIHRLAGLAAGVAASALLLAAPLAAAAAPIEAYGRLPTIADVRLSPGGAMIAYLATTQEDHVVTIFPRDGSAKPILLKVGRPDLRALQWADDEHLVVTTSTNDDTPLGMVPVVKQQYLQAFLYDVRTGKTVLIEPPHELQAVNRVLAEPAVRTVNGRRVIFFKSRTPHERRAVPTLFQMDVASGSIRELDQGGLAERDFMIGPAGGEIARSFFDDGKWSMQVKTDAGWRSAALDARIDVPRFQGLGPNGDTVFVGNAPADGEGQSEARGLRQVSLETGAWLDPVIPGEIIRDPETGLALADRVLDEGAVYHWFDPAMQRHWDAILKAFPGEQVDFVSASADRKVFVVRVFGSKTGAAFMLVDLNTGKGELIGDIYKDVPPADVAQTAMIHYAAVDGLGIPAYLTLPLGRPAKGLPLVVVPHDHLDGRDARDFNWLVQALASRGYAVLQPEYRGSAGFGDDFRAKGYGEWGRKAQSDLSDGVRFLAAQGTVDAKRVCIVGSGFGGFAALEGAAQEDRTYRCAVSLGGVTDIGKMLALLKARAWTGYSAAVPFLQRYTGAQAVSPLQMAGQVQVPVLLIHGRDDVAAPFDQSQAMADALKAAHKPVTFVPLAGEDHALSKSDTRLQALKATVDFLEANNPAAGVQASAKTAAGGG
ncbi:MAG TPA: prolyl oligopeptidase family serine peptidase [Caulobacteraceae bacterium]|jgi:dipeptidyl aminopeptidase/acylaminoacyl peptidase